MDGPSRDPEDIQPIIQRGEGNVKDVSQIDDHPLLEYLADEIRDRYSDSNRSYPPLKDDFQFQELHTIPLPQQKAANGEPIAIQVWDHPLWISTPLEIYFSWNSTGEFWTWHIQHEDELVVNYEEVVYGNIYSVHKHLLFMFIDGGNKAEHVTDSNLGESVELVVVPTPINPAYGEWLNRQDLN